MSLQLWAELHTPVDHLNDPCWSCGRTFDCTCEDVAQVQHGTCAPVFYPDRYRTPTTTSYSPNGVDIVAIVRQRSDGWVCGWSEVVDGNRWDVMLGPYADRAEAEAVGAARLRRVMDREMSRWLAEVS